jgi:hypothetical protein
MTTTTYRTTKSPNEICSLEISSEGLLCLKGVNMSSKTCVRRHDINIHAAWLDIQRENSIKKMRLIHLGFPTVIFSLLEMISPHGKGGQQTTACACPYCFRDGNIILWSVRLGLHGTGLSIFFFSFTITVGGS